MARPPTAGKDRKQPPVKGPTVAALAAELKCSERLLYGYFADGCPRDSAASILAWKEANVRDRQDYSGDTDEAADIPTAKLALLKKQTIREAELGRRYALENSVRSGELVERAEIERDLRLIFNRLRDRLTGIGSDIAMAMPAELKASCKRIADETVRVALKEVADSLDHTIVEDGE